MAVLYSPPLNMAPICICISEQLGFQLVSESIHFCESPDFFDSIQRMLHYIPCITPGSILTSQYFQVMCHATKLFKGYLSQKHNSSVSSVVLKIQSCLSQSCYFQSICVPSFVSLMWESSWPSYDNSIPVDFKSLSRN